MGRAAQVNAAITSKLLARTADGVEGAIADVYRTAQPILRARISKKTLFRRVFSESTRSQVVV